MNILITGGAGFIGAHLCRQLLKYGNRIVCVDNFALGSRNNVEDILKNPYFSLIEGDASQIDFLDSIMAQNETEMVFHMAANSRSEERRVGKEC